MNAPRVVDLRSRAGALSLACRDRWRSPAADARGPRGPGVPSRPRAADAIDKRAPTSPAAPEPNHGRSSAYGRSGARSRARQPAGASPTGSTHATRTRDVGGQRETDPLQAPPHRRGIGAVARRRRRLGRERPARGGPPLPARARARQIREGTLVITLLSSASRRTCSRRLAAVRGLRSADHGTDQGVRLGAVGWPSAPSADRGGSARN